ncbi:MAG: phosphatase PAP2 family protein [Candidatus Thermoplasmatota archaeon]
MSTAAQASPPRRGWAPARPALLAAALVALFLALLVVATAWPGPDEAAHDWVLDHVPAARRVAWEEGSWPGESLVGLGVGLAGAVACALLGARRRAVVAAASAVFLAASVQVLKAAVGRDRPDGAEEATAAFPSGHAATALFAYGLIVLVVMPALVQRWPRMRPFMPFAVGLWIGLALSVGVARVLGGVHWPTDVLAGWAWGGLVLTGADAAAAPGPRPESTRAPQRI